MFTGQADEFDAKCKYTGRMVIVVSVVLSLVIASCEGEGLDGANFEQRALGDFISRVWGPEVFLGECSALTFNSDSPISIFLKSPGYRISLLDVSAMAGLDSGNALTAQEGFEGIAKLGEVDTRFGKVTISEFPKIREVDYSEPKNSWRPADGYLFRFSNRIRYAGQTYLQVWVKSDTSSSGIRVTYRFDDDGTIVRTQIAKNCDDWG